MAVKLRARKGILNVTSQSLNKGSDSLQMFLTGPARTGKSRVIDTLRDYFEKRNQA
jgi:hypothetical protein